VVTATRKRVERLLEGWRERLAKVAVEDLLPLSSFFEEEEEEDEEEEEEEEEVGRRKRKGKGKGGNEEGYGKHVRVVVCVEAEDKEKGEKEKKEGHGEEEEEREGWHDLRARQRGSLHARRGLSAAAGWPYEGGREGTNERGLVHTHAILPAHAMVFVRSPLAFLVVSKGEGGKEGSVSLSLFRGFPLDVSSAATAAAVTVRVEVPEVLRGVIERLACMAPPSCSSSSNSSLNIRTLMDLVTNSKKKGRKCKKEGEEEEEEVEILVRKLVGVLTYHGFLRPWKAEGARQKGVLL